jgi:hypothetical protein
MLLVALVVVAAVAVVVVVLVLVFHLDWGYRQGRRQRETATCYQGQVQLQGRMQV